MMFTRSLVRGVVFPMKFIIVMFFCLESLVGLEFWKAFIFSSSFVQRNSKDRENDNLFFF